MGQQTNREPRTGRRRGSRLSTLALVLAVTLLAAACSRFGGDSGEGGNGDQVQIRFSWWGSGERAEITREAIALFEEEHPNIDVQEDYTDFDAYFDRLATNVAAGDPPDVITLGGSYPAEYAGRGALLDLAEVSDVLRTDKIQESVLQAGTHDGKLYAVSTGVNAYSVVVNPKIFGDAGVELPDDSTWTWEDFARIAQEISANTPENVYGAADPTHSATLEIYARQHGLPGLYTEDGKLALTEEVLAQWLEYTRGLLESGATPSASRTVELAGATAEQTLMSKNQAGMMLGWSNLLATYAEASGQDLQLMKIPGEQGHPGMWLQPSQYYSIAADSEHPREAAMLIDFLINEPAAGKVILTDRGFSANREVREAILPQLNENQVKQAEFLTRLETEIGPPPNSPPVGASETQLIFDRVYPDVLFGELSPEAAAKQMVAEIRNALGE